MLFLITWKPRAYGGTAEQEESLQVFSRWQPPAGVQFQGMWSRPDGGGFGIAEVQSAEALLEATAPWAGVYLDFEASPIVEIQRGVELTQTGIRFRKGG
jgi:hypothetical protein